MQPSGGAPSVVVIGTGFGGLAATIELKRRGVTDLVVLEKGDDVGGVWRENTYPGAACDVPSPFYSFSFAPHTRWPRRFSRQPAILDYLRSVADAYDVRRHVRFGTTVVGATYDEPAGRWEVELDDGERLTCDVLVSAVGQLSRPAVPDLPGRDSFAGPAFHTATWDHDVDLAGKRVAVVGTGASAIQAVPEIARVAGHTTVVQRTPPYLAPRPDRAFGPGHHRMFRWVPLTLRVERLFWYLVVETLSVAWAYSRPLAAVVRAWSRRHMRRQTADKDGLFEQVWPSYAIGCKRLLFSDDYLPALARPDVTLVTGGVERVVPEGIVTDDGVLHPADVVVWGTGFAASEFLAPMTIRGRGGRDLHEYWSEGAHALHGITVPGFPGLLCLYGPNTNTGGGSIVYFLETQASYVGDYVDHLRRTGSLLDAREDVERAYDDRLQRRLRDSVWTRCSSWYRTASGRITTNWPGLGIEYRRAARFDPADYERVRS
ncbi:NAD(P)/FAD-dependent oxidoreductase [uncultured Nocardioides sp.]|uniref:flavin-containing monooxygenase n=1 Tax=uncultured Nocardioides sp. TaxID=198441 RepID=UPI002615A823|nr:NAD(P)/FAD-dependent oxidoreductase [uncultured Nocardioides sp.]